MRKIGEQSIEIDFQKSCPDTTSPEKPIFRVGFCFVLIRQPNLYYNFSAPIWGISIKAWFFQRIRLRQLHSTLPIAELAVLLPEPQNNTGAKPWFDNYGKVTLQFLTAYEGCTDAKLLERTNTDWSMQLFYGTRLGEREWRKPHRLGAQAPAGGGFAF